MLLKNQKKRIENLWNDSQQAIESSTLSDSGKTILHEISKRFIPEAWRNVQ